MKLKPNEPPGHARRKLRGMVSEIKRLREAGHSIRVIHQALKDAGVEVAWSSVQREVARLALTPTPQKQKPKSKTQQGRTTEGSKSKKGHLEPVKPATVDVDGFFDDHNTNPLFKRKK